MKKIISLLLAVLMLFSVVNVAFAADESATAPSTEESTTLPSEEEETEDSLLGEYDWILDLPFGTIAPALKIAKIVLKLAKVYIKLGLIFGFVDKEALMAPIKGILEDLIGQFAPPVEEETTAPATTAPAAA